MKKLFGKKKKINQKLEQEEEEVEGNDAAESLSDHDLLVQIQTDWWESSRSCCTEENYLIHCAYCSGKIMHHGKLCLLYHLSNSQ